MLGERQKRFYGYTHSRSAEQEPYRAAYQSVEHYFPEHDARNLRGSRARRLEYDHFVHTVAGYYHIGSVKYEHHRRDEENEPYGKEQSIVFYDVEHARKVIAFRAVYGREILREKRFVFLEKRGIGKRYIRRADLSEIAYRRKIDEYVDVGARREYSFVHGYISYEHLGIAVVSGKVYFHEIASLQRICFGKALTYYYRTVAARFFEFDVRALRFGGEFFHVAEFVRRKIFFEIGGFHQDRARMFFRLEDGVYFGKVHHLGDFAFGLRIYHALNARPAEKFRRAVIRSEKHVRAVRDSVVFGDIYVKKDVVHRKSREYHCGNHGDSQYYHRHLTFVTVRAS